MNRLAIPLLALALAAPACDGLDLDDPAPTALPAASTPADDGAPAVLTAALDPFVASAYQPGLVRFRVGNAWHTGFLVLPPGVLEGDTTVVITTNDMPLLQQNQCLQTITVEQGYLDSYHTPTATATATVRTYLEPRDGLLVMSLDTPLHVRYAPQIATGLPTRAEDLSCYGYHPQTGTLSYVRGHFRDATPTGYAFADEAGLLDGGGAGWLCGDLARTTLYGMQYTLQLDSRGRPTGLEEQLALHRYRDHIAAQAAVAAFTNPTEVTTRERLANVGSALCADIPNGTVADANVNQYGCHGGANQRWLWKRVDVIRNGAWVPRYQLQSAGTGKCVTITPIGVRQGVCQLNATSQLFERVGVTQSGAPYGKADVRLRSDMTGACLASPGSQWGAQLTTQPCAGGNTAPAQLWRIVDPLFLTWCSPFQLRF